LWTIIEPKPAKLIPIESPVDAIERLNSRVWEEALKTIK